MSVLVNAGRLSQLLKGMSGYRGAYHLELDEGLISVADLGRKLPEFDDGLIYFSAKASQAASVGNFSTISLKVLQGRMVVDAVYIEAVSAAATVHLGIGSSATGNALTVRNKGPGRSGTLLLTSAGSILAQALAAQPASPMFSTSQPANGNGTLLTELGVVLDAGDTLSALHVFGNATNVTVGASFLGRIFTSFPE